MEAEEVVEFAGVASVLLVNTGTLSAPSLAAMRIAAAEYHRLGKPWVLGAQPLCARPPEDWPQDTARAALGPEAS